MTDVSATTIAAAGQAVLTFYRALDQGDGETLAALFSADGEWHRGGEVLQGQAIQDAMLARDASRATVHVVTNLVVAAAPQGGWLARYYVSSYVAVHGAEPRLSAIFDAEDLLVEQGAALRLQSKRAKLAMRFA